MRNNLFSIVVFLLFLQSQFSFAQKIIQMQKEGGVFTVPCKINGVKMKFVFDTGASDVTISLTEARFLLKNDYLTNNDIIGKAKYQDASGNINEGTIINIKKLEFSGLVLFNVKASVVHELNAPLLLGQTAMAKLGKFIFDPNQGTLTIINAKSSSLENSISEDSNANSDFYYKRGVSKFKLKDFNGAIADFSIDIELNPNSNKAYYNRGLCKLGIKDYYGCIEDNSKAIELNPNDSDSYLNRGFCKRKLNNDIGAISDFTMAIELDNNSSKAFYQRGLSKIFLNQKESACEDFSKSDELGYGDAYEMIKKYCN